MKVLLKVMIQVLYHIKTGVKEFLSLRKKAVCHGTPCGNGPAGDNFQSCGMGFIGFWCLLDN